VNHSTGAPASLILYHAEVLAAVVNALTVLDHFRGYVEAPDAEYGMEIEIGPFEYDGLGVRRQRAVNMPLKVIF
jgi:hypothetical protein